MPKQTHGGDDDEGAAPPPQKPKLDLSKYAGGPDANIRDVFWQVMGAYATKSATPGMLAKLGDDRFALVRIAVGVLDSPRGSLSGLTPGFIARYSLMMALDAQWEDAFVSFLEECRKGRGPAMRHLLSAMRKLADSGNTHMEALVGYLRAMLRSRDSCDAALAYLAELGSAPAAAQLKKELIILARGDVGTNQQNAIRALSIAMGDAEVRKTMLVLLSHWDEETRLQAAELLSKSVEPEAAAAAKRRLPQETDPRVKKILEKMAR